MDKNNGLLAKDGVSFLIPFVLITSCFALWGFANDITGPMVKAFSKIFRMSVTEGALVRVAFYLGYFVMAFPAALFIQRYSFKAGVLTGLTLYTAGALMFIPAQAVGMYYPFLLAYFIMTCGLSFLETSCNPYIYCMGSEDTATQRLNLAQAFNPMGALAGMFVAMQYVQARMSPMDSAARAELSDTQFDMVKNHDLEVLIQPYIFIGAVVILLLVLIQADENAESGRYALKEKPAHSTRRTGKNKELSRGGHRPILLRGRTSDVLDIHHPVRNTCVHGRRHGRARRRDSVSEIQYPCHGILHVQPLYLYMVPQISSAGPPALHTGCLRCSGCVRCNPFHRP